MRCLLLWAEERFHKSSLFLARAERSDMDGSDSAQPEIESNPQKGSRTHQGIDNSTVYR